MTGMTRVRRLALGLAVVTAMGAAATPVSAATFVATYTGTVEATPNGTNFFGIDRANIFGGGSLAGMTIKSIFTYNTDSFTKVQTNGYWGFGQSTIIMNGVTISAESPIFISADDLINGKRYSTRQSYFKYRDTRNLTTFYTNEDQTHDGIIEFSPTIAGVGTTAFMVGNVSLSVIEQVDAVPEPATWALMLAGFGMVGGALRIRRRRVMFA